MEKSTILKMELSGIFKERFDNNSDMWLNVAPYANSAIFQAFFERENKKHWKLVPWYGEFPGKLLTGLTECYRMSRDEKLFETGNYIVSKLKKAQAEDGYLGVAPFDQRLIGHTFHDESVLNKLWDVWANYHCIYGLFLWFLETDNKTAYEVCIKAADYICKFFLEDGNDIASAGEYEMNMSASHVFAILYDYTKNEKYLEMTNYLIKAWEIDEAGDYLNAALADIPFYKTKKPRWESLHAIMTLPEMYKITGDEKYLKATKQIWKSILKTDVHNSGGFSSGEGACGDPYNLGAIETCCSVAWAAFSIDYYNLTKDMEAIDELEICLYNGLLGAQHPSGRWWTYNTPMIGERLASGHNIVFQSYAGSPEFNCCSANSARGIGMVSSWAVATDKDNVYLNYFGGSKINTKINDHDLSITLDTDYPINNNIKIQLDTEYNREFTLNLRIPSWSKNTSLTLNGEKIDVVAGKYCEIKRVWKPTDVMELSLDFSLHFWVGDSDERDFSGEVDAKNVFIKRDDRVLGKTSIYYGPILLAYDKRFNKIEDVCVLDYNNLKYEALADNSYPKPWILFKFKDINGNDAYLSDFATAGMNGTSYSTWFELKNSPKQASPIWNSR